MFASNPRAANERETNRTKPHPMTDPDRIIDFLELNAGLYYKLTRRQKPWKTSQEVGFTLFYLLDTTTAAPTVSVSLKVDRGLNVECYAGSGRIEAKFLEPLLNPRCVLESWTQLEALLDFLGSEAISSLSHGAEYYIGEALNNLICCLDRVGEEEGKEKLQFLINQVVLLRCKTYTQHTVDKAFAIYITSSGCYRQIIKMGFLSLPEEMELLKLTGDWEEPQ